MQAIDRFPRKAIPARGVTLIELMVVVAIIGIIAAITLPAYSKYIVNAHRAAAQSHMMDMASRQGEIFADSKSFASKTELVAILPIPAAVSKQYTIEITTTATPPTYKITATPTTTGKQVGDGAITLDYAGVKEPAAKW